jgi:hypothetical protein
MVQTRSAAKKIERGRFHNDDGIVTKHTPVNDPPGNRAPSAAKKRQREGRTAAPKKRQRGKPGEICQLNLDVLFLVRVFLCFDWFADRRDATVIDCRVHPPYRPPQPCAHMQISSTAPHGQILGVRMEVCSPSGQRPS